MDFARKQLEKYGWTDGKGLGKNENGISKAIRPKLKFDNAGIGHDRAEQFTYHWWENVYNQAANNINVKKTKDSVSVQLIDDSLNITTKKHTKFKKSKNLDDSNNMEYGVFLKKCTLTPSGLESIENTPEEIEEVPEVNKDTSKRKSNHNSGISSLTDEEIFAACGGRTAHKGARHGLNLKGKLARIEEQERKLLKKMQENNNNNDDKNNSTVSKKKAAVSPLIIQHQEDVDPVKQQTDPFSIGLNDSLMEIDTKFKKSKKKCEFCNHKRCRCNVFDSTSDTKIAKSGLGKRKLLGIHDTLPSYVGADSKYEKVRDPNDETKIDESPYSENAQNKRRKLGTSSLEEEQKSVNINATSAKRTLKNKAKKTKKRLNKKVLKISDSLEKFNMSD